APACGSSDDIVTEVPDMDAAAPVDATVGDASTPRADAAMDAPRSLDAVPASDGGGVDDGSVAKDASARDDGSVADGSVADAAPDAMPADAGQDAALAIDAGQDAAPAIDAGVDAGQDAAVAPDASDAGGPVGLAAIKTVFTILLENHDYKEVVGSSD